MKDFSDYSKVKRATAEQSFDVSQQFDFSRIFSVVRHSKWIIVGILVVCTGFGFLFAEKQQPQYQSNILLQVNQQQSALSSATSILGALGMTGAEGQVSATGAESILLNSRYVLGPVIETLHLDVIAEPKLSPILGFIAKNHFQQNGLARPRFGLKKYAWGGERIQLASFEVTPDLLDHTFTLIAGNNNEYSLYDDHQNFILSGKVGAMAQSSPTNPAIQMQVDTLIARPGTQFIVRKETQAETIQGLLANLTVTAPATTQTGGYQADSGILQIAYKSASPENVIRILNTMANVAYHAGTKEQSERAAQVLHFLKKQLPLIKHSLLDSEDALSAYQAKTGSLDATEKYKMIFQEIVMDQQSIQKLKLQRTELLQKYTASHPYIITINDKIKQIAAEIRNYKQHLSHIPLMDKRFVELARDVKTKNQLYLMLLAREQEMRVLKAGAISNVHILNYAAEPPLKLPSNKPLIVAVGILLGVLFSTLVVFVRLLINSKITDVSYIEDVLHLPVRSILSFSGNQKKLEWLMKKTIPSGKTFSLARCNPNDPTMEALRSLRTNLQLLLLEASNNCIAISGLVPEVGKSFVSTNLAFIFADINQKILLIDADLRRGHIDKTLGLSKEPQAGLIEYLNGKAALNDVIQCIEPDHLDFISSGKKFDHNTSNNLADGTLTKMLSELSPRYDVIILDTAPLLLVADALLTAKHAGINLLVLAAGAHSHQEILSGIQLFARNNIKLDGAVLNFQTKQAASIYGSQYYGYHARYGDYYSHSDQEK